MRKIIQKGPAIVALLVMAGASAQSLDDYPATVKYERSHLLPDAVAFNMLLLKFETFVSEGDRDHAVTEIAQNLSMEEQQASAFLDQLIDVRATMNLEVASEVSAHSCSEGDGYAVLQELYDVEEAVQGRHLDLVKVSLSRVQQAALDEWLDHEKGKITHVRIDFKKLDESSGKTAQQRLSGLCDRSPR
jgi:hypothetical protein